MDIQPRSRLFLYFLGDVRRALERSIRRERMSNEHRNILTKFALSLERIRLENLSSRGSIWGSLNDVLDVVDLIDTDAELVATLNVTYMRAPFSREGRLSQEENEIYEKIKDATILDAINEIRQVAKVVQANNSADLLEGITVDTETSLQLRRLRNIVPEQKISPISFEVIQNKIVLKHSKDVVSSSDPDTVHGYHEKLLGESERFLEQLKKSNCDRRMLERFESLHDELLQNENPISIGVLNISASMMTMQFKEEISDAVFAAASGVHQGISMYVAQFPQWQEFSENAAKLEIDEEVSKIIIDATEDTLSKIQSAPELADPEVPNSLLFMLEAVKDPQKSSKRAVFALLRTLENLISTAMRFAASIVEKTLEKTADHASEALSKAFAASLFLLVITGATRLAPAASNVQEISWMRPAVEIVQKELSKLQSPN